MVRRTVSFPDAVDALVRDLTHENESFSAAVTRLIEAGARSAQARRRPRYVASGEGPPDLGRRAEEYLRELSSSR
jgi:hypothetical protein